MKNSTISIDIDIKFSYYQKNGCFQAILLCYNYYKVKLSYRIEATIEGE